VKTPSLIALALGLTCSFVGAPARAEPSASLAAAEAAYLQIDFDATRAACDAALREGNHDAEETLRLYTLLGVAASSLGDEDAAKAAFRRVIAVNPEERFDQTLSPKTRAPFLEVRGELMAKGKLEPLRARLLRRGSHLVLELHDPADVTGGVDIAYRVGADASVERWHVAPHGENVRAEPLPETSRVEYTLVLHDESGNTLFRVGSESVPEVLEPLAGRAPEEHDTVRPDPAPFYMTAGLLAASGVATGAVGAVFQVRRESAAREWNGSACEHPGQTRGQQCSEVDQRRQASQNLAIGFYSASGALLVGGLIAWLVAPSAPAPERRASLACAPGVGTFGAACQVPF